jgi:hypothetical protein
MPLRVVSTFPRNAVIYKILSSAVPKPEWARMALLGLPQIDETTQSRTKNNKIDYLR